MQDEVLIRKANGNDLEELCRLIGELFSIEEDFSADFTKQLAGLKMLLSDPERAVILVAESGNLIAGMVTVQLNVSTSEGALSGLLEDMVVKTGFRSKGIGKSLISAAHRWCREQGAVRVQLLADKTNTGALAFYEAVGYSETRMICRRILF
jgi:ribosomal protein S18 acetylase RimI-like enzyme